MEYSDSLEKSSEYLRLALGYMGRYKIPLDPMNYSVWYEFASGKNIKLSNAIESVIEESESISPEESQNLYRKFIAEDNHAIIETIRNEVRNVLDDTLKHMSKMGGNISHYGQVLESYSGLILKGMDAGELNKIVDNIAKETKSMEKSSESFRTYLKSSTKEIEAFRENLQTLREQATTDGLTGLSNRKAFDEKIAEVVTEAEETGNELSLVIADIDHFKKINDSFGHVVGDQVLKKAAGIIKNFIKRRDFVARYGGEEFIVILPETPLKGAVIVAEKLRTLFDMGQWKRKDTGQSLGSVTISLGVTQYAAGESVQSFIQRADKYLYRSKETGRNRISHEKIKPNFDSAARNEKTKTS